MENNPLEGSSVTVTVIWIFVL